MTLHAFSVHSIYNQCSLHIHGVQTVNPTNITSIKQSRQFSHGPCKFPQSSSVFGNCLIHLLVKLKGKPTRSPTVLATLRGNDDSEKRGWQPYNQDDVLNSIYRASEASHTPEDFDVEFVESVHDSETTDETLPSPKREVVEHPLNSQVNLLDRLKAVHLHLLALEQWNASRLKICHSAYLVSAKNLIHFLALQSLDVHQLKEDLSSIGLLNLETVNSYVLASIIAGIQMLENLSLNPVSSKENPDRMAIKVDNSEEFTISAMRKKASLHTESLFGSLQYGRTAHIMVTVGKESTHSETLISDLLKAGANVVRINCAHDDPGVWSEIIRRVKNSSQMLEKPCRILMDLAGPKLRTGQLKAGPNVMKISPKKDAIGNVISPAQVWLSYVGSSPPPAHLSLNAVLFLDDQNFLRKLEAGSVLRFSDVRGRKRMLRIAQKFPVFAGFGFVAECSETAYVGSGTELCIKGKKKSRFNLGRVVNVPAVEQFIRLRVGDLLIISRDPCLSSDDSDRSATDSAKITCSSGRLFDSVKPGDPIAFDDGRIWGVIQGSSISEIIVSITHASLNGSKLGSEKSINIPKSDIQFEGLTSKDLIDLEFVAANADMVGASFIRDPRDIVILQKELEKRKLRKVGIVLKIETQSGFEKLPLLLLQAMKSRNPLGVMIARGDLAVECGWERMADIQEEILSICNAAHVPVIWATQVLESLVKTGLPTRAEITDVGNGRRASCIMLNKGKHIVEAVSTLDSMLCNGSTNRSSKADLKPLVLSSHLSL